MYLDKMNIVTERLMLEPLSMSDARFVVELLNTEDWIKNIGDRNIQSERGAKGYINNIRNNPQMSFWTIKLKKSSIAIGLVTIIKRDYLPGYDVGFALLPTFYHKGYALEATQAVLRQVMPSKSLEEMYAICLKENTASIKLIEKLGMRFEKTVIYEQHTLEVYSASKETLLSKLQD